MKAVTNFTTHLNATLLDSEQSVYLITSTREGDLPIAVIVDERLKNALMLAADILNNAPKKVLNIIARHPSGIISAVHMFEEDVEEYFNEHGQPEDWQIEPLMKTPQVQVVEQEGGTVYSLQYTNTGDAARVIYAMVGQDLYQAASRIINDYVQFPKLWYYVLSKYLSRFKSYVEEHDD